jgi:predicted N-formylglutamate amidohydrolase
MQTLLDADEAPPLELFCELGRSRFVIVCDHAGRELPRSLGSLGLSSLELETHIAWDIGAAGVARRLASELDAVLFLQRYSRLAIDCNRPLTAADSIAATSGGIFIPGNQALTAEARAERALSLFYPYHDRIARELDERQARGESFALIAMHSFTPELRGDVRPFHTGVLYHRDTRLAAPLLAALRREPALVVGDNQPYAASPASDYSIIEHGERRGMPYVEIEIRQDLIADEPGQERWASCFARLLRAASDTFRF